MCLGTFSTPKSKKTTLVGRPHKSTKYLPLTFLFPFISSIYYKLSNLSATFAMSPNLANVASNSEPPMETPLEPTRTRSRSKSLPRSSISDEQDPATTDASEGPFVSAAVRKLQQHDGQWNLYKRPKLNNLCRQVFDAENTELEAEDVDVVTPAEDDDIQGAPTASRSIIENNALSELISKRVCRECHGHLEMTYPTICIATIPTLECLNPNCRDRGNHSSQVGAHPFKRLCRKLSVCCCLHFLW